MYDSLEAMHYNRVKVNRVYVMKGDFCFWFEPHFHFFGGGAIIFIYIEKYLQPECTRIRVLLLIS